ncbi:MAG: hypothetical protein ACP5OA_06000 [Candidatus Woesearchaeota archaeon]
MNLKPSKNYRIASIGLAIGSFIVGTRVLYVFNESQKDNLMINVVIGSIGLAIVVVSVLYMFKNDN